MMQALRYSAVRRRGRTLIRGHSELGLVQHRRSRFDAEGRGLFVGPVLPRRHQSFPQASLLFSSSSNSSSSSGTQSHDAVVAATGGKVESGTTNKQMEEEMRVAADMQALASRLLRDNPLWETHTDSETRLALARQCVQVMHYYRSRSNLRVPIPSPVRVSKMTYLTGSQICHQLVVQRLLPPPPSARNQHLHSSRSTATSTTTDALLTEWEKAEFVESMILATSMAIYSITQRNLASAQLEDGEQADVMLRRLLRFLDTAHAELTPSQNDQILKAFHQTLHIWSRLGQATKSLAPAQARQALQRAEHLLIEMTQKHSHLDHDNNNNNNNEAGTATSETSNTSNNIRMKLPSPNIVSFNTVLHAWCRAGSSTKHARRGSANQNGNNLSARAAAERADAILQLVQELGNDHDNNGNDNDDLTTVYPDHVSYHLILNAWARAASQHPDHSIQRASSLLDEMTQRSQHNAHQPEPTLMTFNLVLDVIAKSRLPTAPAQAESIFQQIKEKGWQPDRFTYAGLISAYTFSAHDTKNSDEVESSLWQHRYKNCLRIQEIINEMDETDTTHDDISNHLDAVDHDPDHQEKDMELPKVDFGNKNLRPGDIPSKHVSVGLATLAWCLCLDSGLEELAIPVLKPVGRAKEFTYRLLKERDPQNPDIILQRQQVVECALEAERLLERFVQETASLPKTRSTVTQRTNTVLYSLAAVSELDRAESVFQRAKELDHVDNVSYWNLIEGFSHPPQFHSGFDSRDDKRKSMEHHAERADHYLRDMEAMQGTANHIHANLAMYNAVIRCWSKLNTLEGMAKAEATLDRLYDNYMHRRETGQEEGLKYARPNTQSFVYVLSGYSRLAGTKSDEKIQATDAMSKVLGRMEQLHVEMRAAPRHVAAKYMAFVELQLTAYNALLEAHHKECIKGIHPGDDICAKSEALLTRMDHLYESNQIPEAKPDYQTLFWCLRICADGPNIHNRGPRTWKMFDRMQRSEPTIVGLSKSFVKVHSVLFKALSQANDSESVDRADNVLFDMEKDIKWNKDVHLIFCIAVASAWANVGTMDAAERAEAVLHRNKAIANIGLYNSVVEAYVNCGTVESMDRAEAVLKHAILRSRSTEQIQLNRPIFMSIVNGWHKLNSKMKKERDASHNPKDRASIIFRLMQNVCAESGETNGESIYGSDDATRNLRDLLDSPESDSANLARDALFELDTKNRVSTEEMEEPLFSAKYLTKMYEELLVKMAYDRNGGLDIAVELVGEILQRYDSGATIVFPSAYMANTVIGALKNRAHSGDAQKADTLLSKLEKRYREGQDVTRPMAIAYNLCAEAWGKDKGRDIHEKAISVMNRKWAMAQDFNDDTLKPDAECFLPLFRACARVADMKDEEINMSSSAPFNVAVQMMGKMISTGIKPNHSTYGYMFLMGLRDEWKKNDPRRLALFCRLFQQCCSEGHLSKFVFRTFRSVVPAKTFVKVLGPSRSECQYEDLPPEWSKNVPPKPKRKHKL